MNKLFKKYQKLAQEAELYKNTLKSKQVFLQLVNSVGTVNYTSVVKGLETAKISPGMLITYEYDAKHAEKLAYWDRFPIVFVTKVTRDGWYGINLHYLHPRQRARIFYDLEKRNIPIIDNEVSILGLKRYLAGQVVRSPKLIPRSFWEIAVMLPFEQFQKRSSRSVWSKARRKSK